eukprot:5698981-Amphidinium_carterae.1
MSFPVQIFRVQSLPSRQGAGSFACSHKEDASRKRLLNSVHMSQACCLHHFTDEHPLTFQAGVGAVISV